MELTGQCKEEFEKWFNINIHDEQEQIYYLDKFYKLHTSMQYGVYVDFFDSVGTRINIIEGGLLEFKVQFWQYDGDLSWIENLFKNRKEARVKAIEKANELYNRN